MQEAIEDGAHRGAGGGAAGGGVYTVEPTAVLATMSSLRESIRATVSVCPASPGVGHDRKHVERGWNQCRSDPPERAGTIVLMEQTGAGPEGVAPPRLRRAGRVIVLDPDDRVLLFRYDDELPNGRHWCTPGGGLNDGEDYAAGARRELAEETGWTDVPLSGEVHERTLTMKYADEIVRQHETFFLGRVELAQRGLGEVTAMHTSDGIAAWHWWTLAEMDTTTEVIWPPGLADLIRGLLGQRRGSWT